MYVFLVCVGHTSPVFLMQVGPRPINMPRSAGKRLCGRRRMKNCWTSKHRSRQTATERASCGVRTLIAKSRHTVALLPRFCWDVGLRGTCHMIGGVCGVFQTLSGVWCVSGEQKRGGNSTHFQSFSRTHTHTHTHTQTHRDMHRVMPVIDMHPRCHPFHRLAVHYATNGSSLSSGSASVLSTGFWAFGALEYAQAGRFFHKKTTRIVGNVRSSLKW
jgi:hypothetical protein